MQLMFIRWQLILLACGLVSLSLTATSKAQTSAPARPASQTRPDSTTTAAQSPASKPAQPSGSQAKGAFQLRVSKSQPRMISLKAEQARVADIASELHRKLDVPVLLSPVMEKARITLELTATPLEGALRLIAPQPYIDYEVTGDGSQPAKIIGIYLYALNEPPPAESTLVRGDSEALLIEGNTEEGTDAESAQDKQEKALSVKIDHNQITLHAHKQPLTAVLGEIANKVDIPFEMKYDSSELVDVDLSNATMEQVVRTLSPNIRLYQRTDLQTYETRPLRIVLAPPTNTQQTTRM
jgi:hypothetical protein